jgi:GH24 family phage-related lysozyme (muramidase)
MGTFNEADHPRDDENNAVCPGVLNKNSDILKKLNAGDYKGAANELDKYIYQTNKKTGEKVILQGLINRRKREKILFLIPDE